MSDRIPASVSLGGQLKDPALIAELADLLVVDGAGPEADVPYETVAEAEEAIQVAITRGWGLELCNEHAVWGEFENVERFARTHHLPYLRFTRARREYDGEVAYYDGRKSRTYYASQDGAPLVLVAEVLAARRSGTLDALLASLDAVAGVQIPPLTLASFIIRVTV